MTEVSIDRFPDIPRIWLDYAAGSKNPLLPRPCDLHSPKTNAEQIRSGFEQTLDWAALAGHGMLLGPDGSIRRLQSNDVVAVVTMIYPSLFGGPASQIWKCLMAIKTCEEMAGKGVSAVPVGILSSRTRRDFPPFSIELLDPRSEPHTLSVPPAQRNDLINQIRKLGDGTYSEEVLELSADAYPAGDSSGAAALRLLSSLMKPWGMLFLNTPGVVQNHPEILTRFQSRIRLEAVRERESTLAGAGYSGQPETGSPESLLCSFILPAVARVVDPQELFSFCSTLPVFDELKILRPEALPYSGVTLADTRSRKILEKYGLEIFALFSGERNVIHRIFNYSAADSVLAKLDGLRADAEQMLSHIRRGEGGRNAIEKDKNSCKEKILYQIQNLQQRFESARREREDAVSRQIHRACNLLAPRERMQESEISGVYFLLRYTQTVLQRVMDRLSAFSFHHQLISME